MADKVTAHKVLVLESHEPNGTFISELFKKRGVDCRLISSPTLAISVLGHESFDVVVSGALRWEQCYQLAFAKYGVGKVILYTASPILARGLRMEGMTVYEKSTTDQGFERSFEGLVNEVMKLLEVDLSASQILSGFSALSPDERSTLRRVLELQKGKRAKDAGWVPAKDLGGTRRNKAPMQVLTSLAERGFLELTPTYFNGRRFKLPDGVHELPIE